MRAGVAMGVGFKFALVVIFGLPALLWGFVFAARKAWSGLIDARFDFGGEEPIGGVGARAMGLYALAFAGVFGFTIVYLGYWMLLAILG